MSHNSIDETKMKAATKVLSSFRLFRDQENLAVETQDTSSENSIPVFADWFNGFKRCSAKRARNGVPWTLEEFNLLREPSNYGKFCRTDIFGSWTEPDLEVTEFRESIFRAPAMFRAMKRDNREKRAEMFQSLASANKSSTAQQWRPSSFSMTCRHSTSEDNESAELPQGNCSRKCYASSRRISLEKLHPRDNHMHDTEPACEMKGTKYLCYVEDDKDEHTFHYSYKTVLGILASRIEVSPEFLHRKISSLENILFDDQPEKRKSAYAKLKFYKATF